MATQSKADFERILGTVSIPTLPEVANRIDQLLGDACSGLPEIAAVVMEDPGLATKVLRLANSAFYGQSEPVVSVQQAAAVLGVRVLRNIVLQASVIRQYGHLEASDEFDPALIWKHAVLTAQVSQTLSKLCRIHLTLKPDEFYTCGLVHEVGKVILLDSLGEDYLAVLRSCRQRRRPVHVAEAKAFCFHHADVGALVAALWNLPQALVAAIRYHHGPPEHIHSRPDVLLVTCADRIANSVRGGVVPPVDVAVNRATRQRIGLTEEEARAVIEQAAESWPSIRL